MKQKFDVKKIEQRMSSIGDTVLRYAAGDIRQLARRSIKSGGRSRQSKSWKTSKPGQVPYYHTGRLKNTIQFARMTQNPAYLVGPTALSGVLGAKVLEHGGIAVIRQWIDSKRPKKRKKLPGVRSQRPLTCKKHGTYRLEHPPLARPNPGDRQNGKYRYFYSRKEWEAARQSPYFLTWANRRRYLTKQQVPLAARPFMTPALGAFLRSGKIKSILKRAIK